ncbi:MAG: ADP-forming succinate--CoA ligase subunit beta [Acidobacteria bacterium]|nr:ADP-forming succinate--CoA ligase subunit beta [Acidobacteriota bacterium]
MKIHEFQAKDILRKFNVKVPRSQAATLPEEVFDITLALNPPVVIKAQIHAGGRGKGGGVKLAHSPREAEEIARRMLGMRLVTHQTGPEGKIVRRVLVEEGLNIQKEYYLGIVIDRSRQLPVFMACAEGGVEIEEVAARNPAAIKKEYIYPDVGFQPYQARQLAFGIGIPAKLIHRASGFFLKLYEAFAATDASLAEINPFIETVEGEFYALDAKMNFDDNALFRHPGFKELRDYSEEDPLEIEASRYHLNYIKLDGNIGCMVNGAGLAMSTMDIIKLAGGNPANFLDVGGGASEEAVTNAFRILLSDEKVNAVLINIFGGIVRCNIIASGVIAAARNVGVTVPIVVRLEGTNVEEGKRLLQDAEFDFILADGMHDAAEKVVALAK